MEVVFSQTIVMRVFISSDNQAFEAMKFHTALEIVSAKTQLHGIPNQISALDRRRRNPDSCPASPKGKPFLHFPVTRPNSGRVSGLPEAGQILAYRAVGVKEVKMDPKRDLHDLDGCLFFSAGTLKGHIRLPDLPDFSHQIRARFQGWLSRLPSGRRCFTGFAHVLEGFHLTDQFGHVAPNGRGQHFHGLDDPVRIDQETAPDVHPGRIIIDPIQFADLPACIGKHGEGNPSGDHLGEFFLLPDLMDETAVHAARQDLHSQRLELFVLDGDRRQFRGSDKGEITGVKAEGYPLSLVVR